jgi:DNA-binding NarL/FixJ family response regulator
MRALLTAESDIDVVGDAETAASALNQMGTLRPDVALLDLRLSDCDCISVCHEIRATLPATACLILSWYSDDQALLGAAVTGAAGYVLMHMRGSDVVSAVRTAAAVRSEPDAHAARSPNGRPRGPLVRFDAMSALTEQERRILDLIGDGLTNKQIAGHIGLSENTIKNYVASLFSKLGMHRRTQAAAFIARQAERQMSRPAQGREGSVR